MASALVAVLTLSQPNRLVVRGRPIGEHSCSPLKAIRFQLPWLQFLSALECGKNCTPDSQNTMQRSAIAFEVDDLAAEIAGKEVLIPPNSLSDRVTVAFIVENVAPVEFLELRKK